MREIGPEMEMAANGGVHHKCRRDAAQAERVFFVIKRVAALARLGQILFQMHRRDQRGVGISMQSFTVQQAGDLLFAQLRQKRFPGAGACIGSLPPIGGHAHQLRTLHLVDNNRLMVALVEHRQVNRFTGIFHQLAQNRVDNRQQITALQEAAADDKRMRAHRPVAQLTDLADKAQLLHGGQQAVSRGVGRPACWASSVSATLLWDSAIHSSSFRPRVSD
jgi:hypothetical protein